MDSYRAALEAASRGALEYLDSLDHRPIAARMQGPALRLQLDRALPLTGTPSSEVIADLVRDAGPGILASASGRFFGWVIGGALPGALAADWLASAWDQNCTLAASAPAAGAVEEIAGAWLKQILDLPREASFAFVTGCQMAHVTCLAAARHALLDRLGWDVGTRGLSGAPPIRVISSGERHGSLERAVRLLGLGSASFVTVGAGEDGRLEPAALEAALEKFDGTAIVALQAGDINIGAFDAFRELIPIARRYRAWVHIDGAFGLWAAASPRFKHLTDGVNLADSWATDGHKWLNVPFDCGYAFVAHAEAHRAAMSVRAGYLTHDAEMRDEIDWTPDWSRRARGFSTYAAIRELGCDGIAAMIERCCDHAWSLVDAIGALDGVEILWRPTINQGLLRFPDPAGVDHDRHTDGVVAAVNASGETFFSATTWRGMRAMRVSVCNWRTSREDVSRAVAAVKRASACAPRFADPPVW